MSVNHLLSSSSVSSFFFNFAIFSLASYFNNGNLSNQDYLKWNRSAYTQTKNGNMVLDKTLNVGFTTPKYISMKAKVPTQKYKHRDCFSRWKLTKTLFQFEIKSLFLNFTKGGLKLRIILKKIIK